MAGSGAGFLSQVASPRFCERLFAHLPDVVFCIKDAQRRYQAANQAFAARLGLADPRRLLGKRLRIFFPSTSPGSIGNRIARSSNRAAKSTTTSNS
jgi:hypothetical protein